MTEVFRFEVIEAMFKKGVLTPDVANNLASWRHSGFHVHASSPFMPVDGDLLRTRLAYAFRPPVALGRMGFDGTTVTVRTQKKQLLQLTPTDFLAKLTTHIPDRYQNIRRYAGLYASVVQARVRRAAMCAEGQVTACSPRAPPQLTFDRYQPPQLGIAYGKVGGESSGEPAAEATDNNAHFNQAPPDNDAFFNQDCEG